MNQIILKTKCVLKST